MKCANCGFFNMPGSDVCGRCSTSLALATAVIDVSPPRASKTTKRLRRAIPARRIYHEAQRALSDSGVPEHMMDAIPDIPQLPLLLRLVVPGPAHFYLHQRLRGHLFLWTFLACLLPGLLWLGTTAGSIWLGLAFSIHSSAAMDAITRVFPDSGLRDRLAADLLALRLVADALRRTQYRYVLDAAVPGG